MAQTMAGITTGRELKYDNVSRTLHFGKSEEPSVVSFYKNAPPSVIKTAQIELVSPF
jgi:hypothetical protein